MEDKINDILWKYVRKALLIVIYPLFVVTMILIYVAICSNVDITIIMLANVALLIICLGYCRLIEGMYDIAKEITKLKENNQ